MTDLVNQRPQSGLNQRPQSGLNQRPEGVNQPGDSRGASRGYIYVASPYSSSSALIREQRFQAVLRYVMRGLGAGELLLSPIVYGHQMALLGLSGGFSFWKRLDGALIDGSCGVRVLKLPGWSSSVGVNWELAYARSSGKEVTYEDYSKAV